MSDYNSTPFTRIDKFKVAIAELFHMNHNNKNNNFTT